jgi:hypothetical protein
MASTQRIIWTALPAGIAGNLLTVRVHIAPRLATTDVPATLESFPDFQDWPVTLTDFEPRIDIPGVTPPIPLTLTSAARSDLWTALFPHQTTVESFAFTDMALHPVKSFSVGKVADALAATYGTAAANPALAAVPPKTRAVADAAYQFIDPNDLPGRYKPSKGTTQANANVKKMRDFFAPYPGDQMSHLDPPAPDFHNAVAALAKYPSLLPLFGLVLTYTFTRPSNMPATGTIRFIPTRKSVLPPSVGRTDVCPRTAFQFKYSSTPASAYFRAAPRQVKPEISAGRMILRLPASAQLITPWYEAPTSLLQFDVEGAARKMETSGKASIGAVWAAQKGAKDTPTSTTFPALTTTGIRLIRNAREAALKAQYSAAKSLNTKASKTVPPLVGGYGSDMTLYAEDVTRGWAVDVYDESSAHWFQLCAREARYTIAGTMLPSPDGFFGQADGEGGFVTTAVTQAPVASGSTPSPTAPVNLHEGLFTWDGWSLVVQRPGSAILGLNADLGSDVGTTASIGGVEYPLGQYALPEFPLTKEFRVPPGSLPRLRFGISYRMRARAVDISGYAAPFVDAPPSSVDLTVSLPLTYRRFEPVPPPPLIPVAPFAPGESAYHLVVRSDVGGEPEGPSQRHVMPPRTAQNSAELHGGFDLVLGPPDPGAWRVVAAREAAAAAFALDENGDGTSAPRASIPDPVPYLPDPIASGAAFWNLPFTAKVTSGEVPFDEVGARRAGLTVTGIGNLTTTKVDFDLPSVPSPDLPGKAWLHKRPFVLKAVGIDSTDPRVTAYGGVYEPSPSAPKWDAADRVLSVGVPKGEQVVVTMSSFTGPVDPARQGVAWGLPFMGVYYWGWARLTGHAALRTMLEKLTRMGANWLISPFRTLTLTHAVKRPLIPPKWKNPSLQNRVTGQTWVELHDYEEVHGPSTVKLDVYARWNDVVDDPSAGPPLDGRDGRGSVPRQQHAFQVPVLPGQQIVLDPKWAVMGPKPNSKNLPFPNAAQNVLIALLGQRQRHYIGDTRFRNVEYRAVSTTRYQEFFAHPVLLTSTGEQPLGVTLDVFTRHSGEAGGDEWKSLKVLSTARPDAPKLRWIVPSFGWDRSVTDRSVRTGGLRIFLDRPWYSSGDNELLGIVFWKPAATGLAKLEPYLSYAAHDPTWRAGTLGALMVGTDFKKATRQGTGLYLEEVGGYKVNVAGHTVGYDAERDLYFADVVIDPHKDYWPFVRLALCRYQPDSISGCELSRVVVADFAQLAPNRTAQIVYGPANATVAISVYGVSYAYSSINAGTKLAADDRAHLTVTIEGTADADPTAQADNARSWVALTDPVDLVRTSVVLGTSTWEKTLTFSQLQPALPPKAAYRLAIREYERFAHHDIVGGLTTYSQSERLVYAETLPLTPPVLLS